MVLKQETSEIILPEMEVNDYSPVMDITHRDRFYLAKSFIADYEGKQPEWGPVGFITYKRTYARPLPDSTTEEYWQTCQRVIEGTYTIQKWHCRKLGLPWNAAKAQKSAQEMFKLMWNFKFIPPGRGLWMMGTDYVERYGGAALNNCAFTSTEHIAQDFAEPFCFLMDMSMLGVGVGGNTAGEGKVKIKEPTQSTDIFVVEDSREGWVKLTRRILNSYVSRDTLPSAIDYSKVRPIGAKINGFGGTAAGPQPLINLIEGIKNSLDPLVGKPITSTAIVDIFNKIGVCVVSGNVRRSAEIMLGEPTDTEFTTLKDPTNKEALYGWRWASNNSIYATVGMDYTETAASAAKNGEPGVFFLETARAYGRMKDYPDYADKMVIGTNPCSEQSLESFELCCLVETFPSRHETYEEYQNTLKYAYLYAKTVTLVPTHNARTNAVVMRNRRIGCSQSGIVESFAKHGRRTHFNWSDMGYTYLRKLDAVYSDWLCVPKSKKITSVKPSGTVSLLPGVTPGMHYEHAEYYYRTIRIAKSSKLIQPLRNAHYHIEDDKYDSSSYVVYFPIHAKYFERSKNEVSMWEQLENAAQMQYYWADNQVSVTITFKPEEAPFIKEALELYESRLKSISFLPLMDHMYEQAPYITITKEEYEKASSKLRLLELDLNTHEKEDKFCDGDRCEVSFGGVK